MSNLTGNPEEIYGKALEAGLRPNVYLGKAGHKGLGVFAGKPFAKEELIEMCHCIQLAWQARYQRDESIAQYAFAIPCHCNPGPSRPPCLLNCPLNGHSYILPLGFGACYNSADQEEGANARYGIIQDKRLIFYVATKDISEHEEILTWFGRGYYDQWCKPNKKKK